MQVLLECD